jgi:hypothetical protein
MAIKSASKKQLSQRVIVNITRDMTAVTPKIVWQHEIPILEEIFGDGAVKDVTASSLDEGYSGKISPELLAYNKLQDKILPPSSAVGLGYVFAGDPEAEYDRLASVYGRHKDENVLIVEKIYGRFQSGKFTEVVSGATFEDMPDAQLRELIVQHGWLPVPHKDASESEKAEAHEKRKALIAMKHPELVELAQSVAGELV